MTRCYIHLGNGLGSLDDVDASTAQVGENTLTLQSDGTYKVTPASSGGDVLTVPLTGFTSGSGIVTTSDTILSGIEKLDGNINAIGGKNVTSNRFATISSGTSGTITLPANSTVKLDDFGGTVDAIITGISGGRPNDTRVLDASNVVVATTFDTNGNYVLSSAPSNYPVALIYRVNQTLANFDSTSSNIHGEYQITPTHSSLVGLNADVNYQHITKTQADVIATTPYYLALSSYNITAANEFIGVAGSGSVVIQLPQLSTVPEGKVFEIKQLVAGTSTVVRPYNNSENMDASTADYNLSGQHDAIRVVAGTSQWRILNKYSAAPKIISGATALGVNDVDVIANGSSNFTVTLQSSILFAGNYVTIKNAGSSSITITPQSPAADTIDGVLGSLTLFVGEMLILRCVSQNNWVTLLSNKHIDSIAVVNGVTNEGPIKTNVLSTLLQSIAHSLVETGRSGLQSWSGSGNYWSWVDNGNNTGTFTLLRAGEGYIKYQEITWVASQTVTLSRGEAAYLYIDTAGLLKKSSTNNVTDKSSRINLFLAQNDINGEFLAIRNDHKFTFDNGTRHWVDDGFGLVCDNTPGACDISRYGTGTGASATDRQINISAGKITDADIEESWTAITTGVTANFTYINAGGYPVRYSYSKEFPMVYIATGVPTAISSGNYGVAIVFLLKSDLNSAPPQFIVELTTAQYTNETAARTAISNGIYSFAALNKEHAQVGYAIIRNNASGGYVVDVIKQKTTLRSTVGGSGVGSTANNILTSTANFNGVLSAADPTVQSALETIDDTAQRKDSIGATINALTEKTTIVDADMFGLMDSANSNILKKLSWANIKAAIDSYFASWRSVVSATISQTTVATTNTAVTLSQGLVLGVGYWRVEYSCSVLAYTGATANDRVHVKVWIYENSAGIATVYDNTQQEVYAKTVTNVNDSVRTTVSSFAYVTVTSGTLDFRLGCIRDPEGTTNSEGYVYANSKFVATKLGK